jgi:hypothetical protein
LVGEAYGVCGLYADEGEFSFFFLFSFKCCGVAGPDRVLESWLALRVGSLAFFLAIIFLLEAHDNKEMTNTY